MAEDVEADLIAAMIAASEKVRHPGLLVTGFLSPATYEQLEGDLDDSDDLAPIPAAEIETAHARRGAVIMAAEQIIDQCIDDLQEIDFDDDGRPDADRFEDSFVYRAFPRRHRRAYDQLFFRRVLITVVKVAQDFANPDAPPAACTAEEIIVRAIGRMATSLCDLAGIAEPEIELEDALLEDVDFEYLFDAGMDGIETDPASQAAMGVEVPDVSDWFSPFNDTYVVHPYAETEAHGQRLMHNLLERVDDVDEQESILESDSIDSPAPIAGLEAASDVVAAARRAAADDRDATLWVPDEGTPESSFADLVATASRAHHGSGRLTWEPFEGADIVRTDPVVSLTPHRHFPVGEDCPWVWAAVGGGQLQAIPLSVVVSYRADNEVQRRWNNVFSLNPADRS